MNCTRYQEQTAQHHGFPFRAGQPGWGLHLGGGVTSFATIHKSPKKHTAPSRRVIVLFCFRYFAMQACRVVLGDPYYATGPMRCVARVDDCAVQRGPTAQRRSYPCSILVRSRVFVIYSELIYVEIAFPFVFALCGLLFFLYNW